MAISTNINSFAKPHNNEGGSSGVTYVRGAVGNADLPADLNVTSITAQKGDINILNGGSLSFDNGQFIYLGADEGYVSKLRGDEIRYSVGQIDNLTSDLIKAGKVDTKQLNVDEYAWIKELQSNTITTEYLTVTKQAHFFELIIDKIRSIGGQLMITQANCVVDYVKAFNSSNVEVDLDSQNAAYYDVFFLAHDASGRSITNDWLVYDQALCQSFNNVSTGVNYDVSNKYYWRLVTSILADRYMNLNTGIEKPLSEASTATVNSVTINAPALKYTVDSTDYDVANGWNTVAQNPTGIISGVTWTQNTGGANAITNGTMTTTNTIFGIQMTPIADSVLSTIVPQKFSVECSNARLSIGIYYKDGTSSWFPAPEQAQTYYEYDLETDSTVEAVVITNADEVQWKLVHGIRLSNTDCDLNPNADSSYVYNNIPSKGDNIVQLGYRYQNEPTYPSTGTDAQKKAWIEANGPIYDRAAAQIISTYKSPDTDVRPPAYAQYVGINDYTLANHRGTYIDATGGYFKGNLVTESGNLIAITDDGFNVDVEFYKIIPDTNVITIDTNSTIYPSSLVIKFLKSGESSLSNTVPTGCTFNYAIDNASPTTISAGNTVTINISGMSANSRLTMNLMNNTDLVDTNIMTVTSVQASGSTGKNGQYTQWAYKNAATSPSAPATSNATYPPTGWSAVATTPSSGQYTWCTERTIKFDNSNNPIYTGDGTWCTPYRITGENGQPGEDGDTGTAGADGKYTEFIYKHYTSVQTSFSGQDNPANWTQSSAVDSYNRHFNDPDYTGPSTKGWSDHPQGIGTIDGVFYEIEYMSQRQFNGTSFEPFTEPKIWSRWGQNGRDGDGYEYIYINADSNPTDPNNITYGEVSPTGVANGNDTNKNQDDWVPNGWTDEPQGVSSSSGHIKEYVSTRKKVNGGAWGNYSTPALWAQYVPQGTNGGRYVMLYQNYNPTTTQTIIPDGSTEYSINTLINAGWSRGVGDPDYTNGEYTYMTQAFFNDGQTNSLWTAALRITGADGEPGTDGTDFEFIYTRNNGTLVNGERVADPPAAPEYDSGGNPVNEQDDWYGTDLDGVYWTDSPQGVQSNMQFEYVVQRKKLSGNTTWEDYEPSTASVWSKWGEKGQDGDGYEYIYCLTATENDVPELWQTYSEFTADKGSLQSTNKYANVEFNGTSSNSKILKWKGGTKDNNYSDTSTWHDVSEDEYLPPNEQLGHVTSASSGNPVSTWTDEPQGVSIDYKAEWVAVRKKEAGVWGTFSTPSIWAMYGGTGPQGATGPTGPQGATGDTGENAEYDVLVPIYENFYVMLNAQEVGATKYENITGKVFTNLKYAIAHINGDTVTYLNGTQLQDYKLHIDTHVTTPSGTYNPTSTFDTTTSNIITTGYSINGTNVAVISFQSNNLLESIWTNIATSDMPSYHNYYKLCEEDHINRAPNSIAVTLVKSNANKDSRNITLSFKASHLFSVTDSALNSIYQGLSGTSNAYTTTGMSYLQQTWNQIKLGVTNIQNNNWSVLPTNSETVQYVYRRTSSNTQPDTPGSSDWGVAPSDWNNNYTDTSSYWQYVWQSHRTRDIQYNASTDTISYSTPTSWSTPVLVARYGVPRTNIINSAQLSIEADQIKSTVTADYQNAIINGKQVVVDLTDVNEATFVPVGVSFHTASGQRGEGYYIVVEREFDDSYGAPNYSTHSTSGTRDGFILSAGWHTIACGWGTNWGVDTSASTDAYGWYDEEKNGTDKDSYRFINYNNHSWTKACYYRLVNDEWTYEGDYGSYTPTSDDVLVYGDCIIGGIRQNYQSDIELFYLRGGSKYNVHTDNWDATVTPYKTGYMVHTGTHQVYMLPLTPSTVSDMHIPVKDQMKKSEIIQTADNIQLNVEEKLKKTGIDISLGKITLDAENTDILGNLNLKRTDNGMTVYDSNGNPRINIRPNNLPSAGSSPDMFSTSGYAQTESAQYIKIATANVNATTNKVSLGTLSSGNTLTIVPDIRIYGATVDGVYSWNETPSLTVTINLYYSTSTSASFTNSTTITRTGSAGSYEYPEPSAWTVTVGNSGSWYATVNVNGADSKYTLYTVYAYINYTKKVSSLTYIGTNGFLSGETNQHFAKIANDGIELRWIGAPNRPYSGTSIKLDNTGFKRVYNFDINTGPISWVGFDGYSRATVLSTEDFSSSSFYYGDTSAGYKYNYIVKADDVYIFVPQGFGANSSTYDEVYIRLGDGVGGENSYNALSGRHIFIRNLSGKTVYVCAGNDSPGFYLMNRDNATTTNRISLMDDSWDFMACPEFWDGTKLATWMIIHQN